MSYNIEELLERPEELVRFKRIDLFGGIEDNADQAESQSSNRYCELVFIIKELNDEDLVQLFEALSEESFNLNQPILYHKLKYRITPLMIASYYGKLQSVKYLIETAQVDVNAIDAPYPDGMTAIQYVFLLNIRDDPISDRDPKIRQRINANNWGFGREVVKLLFEEDKPLTKGHIETFKVLNYGSYGFNILPRDKKYIEKIKANFGGCCTEDFNIILDAHSNRYRQYPVDPNNPVVGSMSLQPSSNRGGKKRSKRRSKRRNKRTRKH